MTDKLLWHSNAPWAPTGYGSQTSLFTERLKDHYDIGISAFYGLEGAPLRRDGITIYPGLTQTYGNEVIAGHAGAHFGDPRGGLVVTLMDVWVLDPAVWRDFNVACWVPVDHEPTPPMVGQFLTRSGAVPIAMSRFGQEQLKEFDPLYCPHAVDTKAYKPTARAEAREKMGFSDDAFVVGVVAANKGNPSRKSFSEILQAFARFRQTHDDAVLYLHTEATGRYNGVQLSTLARGLGIPPRSLRIPDQYRIQFNPLPPEVMALAYSSMDVLLSPSRGEGFGIPVLEGQACGVPVIVTDFSAMSEVGAVGWKVGWDREWSVQQSWQARPRLDEIVESLEHAYRLPRATREEMARDAREHALGYDVDRVMAEFMLPALEQARARFAEREPVELAAA